MAQRPFLFLLMLMGASAAQAQRNTPPVADSLARAMPLKPVPRNFYSSKLGFFCKQELQLQKRTGVNVYFRLGFKSYVDYLEQKPGARRPAP